MEVSWCLTSKFDGSKLVFYIKFDGEGKVHQTASNSSFTVHNTVNKNIYCPSTGLPGNLSSQP